MAGCGGPGGGNGLSAQAARFDARIAASGATLHATGVSCSGLYGSWKVRLRVSGVARGDGATGFTLEHGREAQAPVAFKIHTGIVSGRATGVLHVRGAANALVVKGRITVKVPLETLSREISETIPVTFAPGPECGLSAP